MTEEGHGKYAEFFDANRSHCSISTSSVADNFIHLGVETHNHKPNMRMHLSQDMAKALLPHLQKFAETGEL